MRKREVVCVCVCVCVRKREREKVKRKGRVRTKKGSKKYKQGEVLGKIERRESENREIGGKGM